MGCANIYKEHAGKSYKVFIGVFCEVGRSRHFDKHYLLKKHLRLQVLFCKIFICVEDSETSRISQKLTPRSLEKSPGVIFYINMLYFLYLSAMFLPMSTPMTEAIIRPLVQPLESPRQWSPLTLVSKLSSIFMRLE